MDNNRPLRLFVAMPGTNMGSAARWNNPEQIKKRFFEKIREDLEKSLNQKVELIIEKDKVLGGAIHPSMFKEAWEADVYIADLTGNNPNVYLELGVRWALKDNVTVIVSQDVKDVRFNVSNSRIIPYEMDFDNLDLAREKVAQAIKEGLANSEYCDSPVRQNANIQTYRRDYVEGIEEENRRLKAEQGLDYLNAAKATKDSQARLQLLKKAIEVNSNLHEALFYLGVELRKLGDYEDAISNLRKAINLNPTSDIYHRELGVAYSKNNQLKEAVNEFDEAVAINPKDEEAWNNRGGTLRKLGTISFPNQEGINFLKDARNSYGEAYSIDNLSHYALGNMARLDLLLSRIDLSRMPVADHEFKKLRFLCDYKLADEQDSEKKSWLMFDLADSYLLLGEIDEGLRLYDEAIKVTPSNYRKSTLSTVFSPLKELLTSGVLENKIEIASEKILEKLKQVGNFESLEKKSGNVHN